MLQRTTQRWRNSEAGFSLTELLVVVVIIGILMSVINASYYNFYNSVASKGFASAIVAKAREARNLTKSLNSDIYMVFDLNNERVWIEVDSGTIYGSAVAPSVSTVELKGFMQDNNDGLFVTTGQQRITFTAHNTCQVNDILGCSVKAVLHIGSKSTTYGVKTMSRADFKSIMFYQFSTLPVLHQEGCVSEVDAAAGNPANDWLTWFDDPAYPWVECVAL